MIKWILPSSMLMITDSIVIYFDATIIAFVSRFKSKTTYLLATLLMILIDKSGRKATYPSTIHSMDSTLYSPHPSCGNSRVLHYLPSSISVLTISLNALFSLRTLRALLTPIYLSPTVSPLALLPLLTLKASLTPLYLSLNNRSEPVQYSAGPPDPPNRSDPDGLPVPSLAVVVQQTGQRQVKSYSIQLFDFFLNPKLEGRYPLLLCLLILLLMLRELPLDSEMGWT